MRTDPSFGPKPKKALGQNFLVNPGIAPKMIEASGLTQDYGVLEIGPGLGALTKELAPRAKKVVAIELDGDVIPKLQEAVASWSNVEIIRGDVMELPVREIMQEHFGGMPTAVFGNLPYYITSPIIMRLLTEEVPAEFITVMVQKEAAQRLAAAEGSRDCGAVSLAVRYYAEPEILFDVQPGSFYPRPKVTSSVMKLVLRKHPPVDVKDTDRLFSMIRAAFSQRRKTLQNSVSSALGIGKDEVRDALRACGIPENVRPEELGLRDYAALSDSLK
ncbi:MAG: ribosomal RNA small subunit methyltransferase A [Oscillospiraceae bacterium]|nr:ribosomal RNA small subunit methyltransferase A [Oscillospiraceae bacterium]